MIKENMIKNYRTKSMTGAGPRRFFWDGCSPPKTPKIVPQITISNRYFSTQNTKIRARYGDFGFCEVRSPNCRKY